MKVIILTAILAFSMEEFPELPDNEFDAELVEPDEGAGDTVGTAPESAPERNFEELAPDEVEVNDVKPRWETQNVQPKVVEPPARVPQAPAARSNTNGMPPPILTPKTATSDDNLNAGPVPDLTGKSTEQPFIAGYNDFLWMDSLAAVKRAYGDDNPLVEQSGNRYLVSNHCEGEEASVIFSFDSRNELSGVICQFAKGVVDYAPDYPMYQKIRQAVVSEWGQPQVTNESPAPDSPVQAAQWRGKAGRATLSFDLEKKSVQLRVERNDGS